MNQKPQTRPTHAQIDLEAIRHNVRFVRQCIGESPVIMAIIKSDGYGHGMLEVGKAALEAGATAIGVATSDEALSLRETKEFQTIPLLVVGPTLPSEANLLQEANIAISIGSNDLLLHHLKLGRKLNKAPMLHLQMDTGIGRDGFRHDDFSFLDHCSGNEKAFEGLWMHFAVADSITEDDIAFTNLQCDRFDLAIAATKKAGFNPITHAANSGAIIRHPRAHYQMVRPGLMIYGMEPAGDETLVPELKQALSFKSALSAIKTMEPGDTVSYGRTFEVTTRHPIGIIPLGYGDGYLWRFANKGIVLVNGKRVPIAGRVCMDQFMVDLSDVPKAKVGDEVVIYGQQKNERMSLEEAARIVGTINYELTCSLTNRVPRLYINK
jgi:alanine racemase